MGVGQAEAGFPGLDRSVLQPQTPVPGLSLDVVGGHGKGQGPRALSGARASPGAVEKPHRPSRPSPVWP